MAAGGSAVFGGADDGGGTMGGLVWSRRWRRDNRPASVEPMIAAEPSAGFGGADDGRGRFGSRRGADGARPR